MTSSGVEWVVACLAPWTISPHPNFRTKYLSDYAQLALVSENRGHEIASYFDREPSEDRVDPFVAMAASSTIASTQSGALPELLKWATEDSERIGRRVAAWLYVLLAASELDELEVALSQLMTSPLLAGELGIDRPEGSASHRLIVATLLLQCAFRLEEVRDLTRAESFMNASEKWFPSGNSLGWDTFDTSQGINWSSKRVQLDLLGALRRRVMRMRARLEFPNGDTWEQVVRSRPGWIDYRLASLAEYAYRDAAKDSFTQQVATLRLSQTTTFGNPRDREYELVLLAELGADRDLCRQSRAAQAWSLVNERDSDGLAAYQAQQALRLLRQAEDNRGLSDLVEWLRARGPLEGLLSDAQAVVRRVSNGGYVSSEDLLVIGGAADLLPVDDIDAALNAVLAYVPRQSSKETLSWSALNDTWKAVSRFSPIAGRDEFIAARALDAIGRRDIINSIVAQTIVAAVNALDWSAVSPATRDGWASWAISDVAEDMQAVQSELAIAQSALQIRSPLVGLTGAAWLIENRADATSQLLEDGEAALSAALDKDLDNAAHGATAFGGYDSGGLSALFARSFDRQELWEKLTTYLLDDRLSAELKTRAFEQLAMDPESVPFSLREQLSPSAARLLEPTSRHPFSSPQPRSVNPSALRALIALRLLEPAEFRGKIFALMGEGEIGRLEAAKTLEFPSAENEAWVTTALVVLASDRSADVSAQACYVLMLRTGQGADHESAQFVRELLEERFAAEGVRVPLRLIHACQRLAAEGSGVPAWAQAAVQDLAARSASAIIRRAAARVGEL